MFDSREQLGPWILIAMGSGAERLSDGTALVALLSSAYPKGAAKGLSIGETLRLLRSYELTIDGDLPTRAFLSLLKQLRLALNDKASCQVGTYDLPGAFGPDLAFVDGDLHQIAQSWANSESFIRPPYSDDVIASVGAGHIHGGASIFRPSDHCEWLSLFTSESEIEEAANAIRLSIPGVAIGFTSHSLSSILCGGIPYEELFADRFWTSP